MGRCTGEGQVTWGAPVIRLGQCAELVAPLHHLGNTTNFYNMNTSGDWNNNNASNAYLPAAGFHPREDRV